MKRTLRTAASGAAAFLVLAGCSGGPEDKSADTTAPPAVTASAQAPSVLAYGQTHVFPTGATLRVDAPTWYATPLDTDDVPPQMVRVSATLVNSSAATIDMSVVETSATFAGQPAEIEELAADDIVNRGGTLLPGQTQRFDLLFRPQVGDLNLEIGVPGAPVSVFFVGPVPLPPPVDEPAEEEPIEVVEPVEETVSCGVYESYVSDDGETVCLTGVDWEHGMPRYEDDGAGNERYCDVVNGCGEWYFQDDGSCGPNLCGDNGEGMSDEDYTYYCMEGSPGYEGPC